MSTGFCVATTMNGSGTGQVTPSTVTCASSMHSSRAACVFGDARLISSPITTFANTAPGLNSNRATDWSNTLTPVTSEGSRSGVNWMRLMVPPVARASAFASIVLPTPGTSSISRWPPASMTASAALMASSLPSITVATAARTRSADARTDSAALASSVERSVMVPSGKREPFHHKRPLRGARASPGNCSGTCRRPAGRARGYSEGVTDAPAAHWVLTFVCADRPGIVHALSGAIVDAGGNITESQQFSSDDTGRFFIRMQVQADVTAQQLAAHLQPVAARFDAECRVDVVGRPLKTLVLVSRAAHCLNDLLFRQRSGLLPIEIPLVLGNHGDLAGLAGFYGVPFEARAVTSPVAKAEFEERVLAAVEEHGIELVVLARYMQILSPQLCERLSGRIINIHHSFLPGFKGANPYKQAHARGVKLIGATAHFVTADLDEGPIIEQNVVRVDHAASVRELVGIGQDEESRTLTRAVRWFAEHRVLLDGKRTIIFR